MTAEIQERSLRDYARIILDRRWVIIAAIAATMVSAIALTAFHDPVYQSEARLLVDTSLHTGANITSANAQRQVQTELQVLHSDAVARRVASDLGLSKAPPAVVTSVVGVSDVVAVRVRAGSPAAATQLADGYIQAYLEVARERDAADLTATIAEVDAKIEALQSQIDRLADQIAAAAPEDRAALEARRQKLVDSRDAFQDRVDQIDVDLSLLRDRGQQVRPAMKPSGPIEPQPVRTALLAALLGLVIGMGAALLMDQFDDSLRDVEHIQQLAGGRTVLAVVPQFRGAGDDSPLAISSPRNPAVEQVRALRTCLAFLSVDQPVKVVQITSASAGDGKTTIATNLAVVMSQRDQRVLLIDTDLRKPRVASAFGLEQTPGLSDVLLHGGLAAALRTHDAQLTILPAGTPPPNPSELLSSAAFRVLLTGLSAQFDLIVLDSAPILPVTDAVELAALADATVLVASADRTTATMLATAVERLNQVDAPLVGVVLNRAPERGLRSYGYGYGYGETAGQATNSTT